MFLLAIIFVIMVGAFAYTFVPYIIGFVLVFFILAALIGMAIGQTKGNQILAQQEYDRKVQAQQEQKNTVSDFDSNDI